MGQDKNILWIFMHIPKTGGSTLSRHVLKNLPSEETLRAIDPSKVYHNSKVKYVEGHASTYNGCHKFFSGKIPRYLVFLRDPAERLVSEYNYQLRNKTISPSLSFERWYGAQIKNEMTHMLSRKYEGKEGTRGKVPKGMVSFFRAVVKIPFLGFLFRSLSLKTFAKVDETIKGKRQKIDNAKKMLDLCYFVGIINYLNRDLPGLFKQMGVPTKWKNVLVHKEEAKNLSKEDKEVLNFYKLSSVMRKKIYKENPFDVELFAYAKKMNEKTRKRLL